MSQMDGCGKNPDRSMTLSPALSVKLILKVPLFCWDGRWLGVWLYGIGKETWKVYLTATTF